MFFFTYNFQVDPLFQVPKGSERLWCIHINFIRCSSKPHFGNGKTQWTRICGDNFCLGPFCSVMLLLFADRSKRFEYLHDYDPTYHGQSKTDSKLYILSTISTEQNVLAHNPKVILYKSHNEKAHLCRHKCVFSPWDLYKITLKYLVQAVSHLLVRDDSSFSVYKVPSIYNLGLIFRTKTLIINFFFSFFSSFLVCPTYEQYCCHFYNASNFGCIPLVEE